jgi:hypothetical protein
VSEEKIGNTLCKDIGDQVLSSSNQTIEKNTGEQGLAAFNRYIADQAAGWCDEGLCSTGTCKGHLRDTTVNLISETDDNIVVSYRVTIYCECG